MHLVPLNRCSLGGQSRRQRRATDALSRPMRDIQGLFQKSNGLNHHRSIVARDAPTQSESSRSIPKGRPKKPVGIDESPLVLEEGAPDLPKPAEYQQTLIKSFTMGGIGLHTGEYSYLRVRPAFANEGRYFVRVPPGTNADLFELQGAQEGGIEELGPNAADEVVDTEIESLRLQLFQEYLEGQEKGFEGTFPEYIETMDAERKEEVIQRLGLDEAMKGNWTFSAAEEIESRHELQEGLPWWPAIADTVQLGVPLTQVIKSYRPPRVENYDTDGEGEQEGEGEGEGDAQGQEEEEVEEVRPEGTIQGAQLLLSALEALGVDNARIEIEGGCEVPVLDGSALGWVIETQFAGLRPAPPHGTPNETPQEDIALVQRCALRSPQPVIVRQGDAFVMLMPEETMRLTVGIDHKEAEVIGKQWMSWCLYEDMHYRFEIAGARQYYESPEQVLELRGQGLLRGGTDGSTLVAYKDRWWDSSSVRFVDNEPVRHALADLIGDLSLNAAPGHSGLPIGHVIAYKPNHDLVAKFVKTLRSVTSEDDWIPMMDMETIEKASKAGFDMAALLGLNKKEEYQGVTAGPIEGEEWLPMDMKDKDDK